jgi:hypothetical protein
VTLSGIGRILLVIVVLVGCNDRCYLGGYLSLTNYKVDGCVETTGGVRVCNDFWQVDLDFVDSRVDELEECLGVKIKRGCFAILIPNDWFISACSGEQMLPVAAPYSQCEYKGIYLPEECRGLSKPTTECPCVCTYRTALQDDFYIVTPPDLKLFKVDLSRLVTNINNVFGDPAISKCLR